MKRIRESIARAGIGWVNTYSHDELHALFVSAGFTCVQTLIWEHPDGAEQIFVFRQEKERES
jgi:hypothetical protein